MTKKQIAKIGDEWAAMDELKVGDVIVNNDGVEVRERVLEVLGQGETEQGFVEERRYKTELGILGHVEIAEYLRVQEVEMRIERA